MSNYQAEYDARRALKIARRHRFHANAVKEIIMVNLAADVAEADELIYEGERLGPEPKPMPPGARNIFGGR